MECRKISSAFVAYIITAFLLSIIACALFMAGNPSMASCVLIAVALLIPADLVMLITEKIDEKPSNASENKK